MRPALLAPLAPALLLVAAAVAWARGEPHAARAWDPWLPALLAFAGVLGPSLLARGSLSAPAARALVMSALAALLTYGILAFFIPLGPGETSGSRLFPGVDVVLSGALVAFAALGIRPLFAALTWVLAATLLARAAGAVASSAAVGIGLVEALVAALFWLAAALLASTLALVRFTRRGR